MNSSEQEFSSNVENSNTWQDAKDAESMQAKRSEAQAREMLTNVLESLGYEVGKPIRPTFGELNFRRSNDDCWIDIEYNSVMEDTALLPLRISLPLNLNFEGSEYDIITSNVSAPKYSSCKSSPTWQCVLHSFCLPVKSNECSAILQREVERMYEARENYTEIDIEIKGVDVDEDILSLFKMAISKPQN